jgi:hypothetical protein
MDFFTPEILLRLTLVAAAFGVTQLVRRWFVLYELLYWPATVLHELAHFTVGFLLGAQPVKFSAFPRKAADGSVILGEVHFRRLAWFNKIPVGAAPLGLIPIGLWVISASLPYPILGWPFVLYSVFSLQCFVGAWPSSVDWEHVFSGAVVLAVGLGLFWILARYL